MILERLIAHDTCSQHYPMIDFDYTVQKSRRRSASIQIDDGHVFVKVPHQVDEAWIQALLVKRAHWIRPRLEQQRACKKKYEVDPDSGSIPLLGESFSLTLTGADTPSSINVSDQSIHLSVSSRSTHQSRQRHLKSLLYEFAQTSLKARAERLSMETSLVPSIVQVANFKRKWGQCSNLGVISLNWRLVHLPTYLQDYVIIHELCHLKEMNHSSRFWSLVHTFYPEYRVASQEIKSRFSFLNW